jgi:cytochrome c6
MQKKKLLSFLLSFNIFIPQIILAADVSNGETIFNANCSACHAGGNNVIVNEKTLKKDVLETNGMDSVDAIVYQVTNGKNAMPAFGGRLTDNEIEDAANYVLTQSEKGWK